MTLLHLTTIALVQGITEFLPVSSSGHLALIPSVTGWPDQGLAVDVAAHIGSLGAVCVYFRRDIVALAQAAARIALGRSHPARRLLWILFIATLPALFAGTLLTVLATTDLRDPAVIAWAMIIGAIALYVSDRWCGVGKLVGDMSWRDGLWIGLAQTLALIPGTSRAGITMTAARILGYRRVEAARFSMLLSIPVILGAGVLQGVDLLASGDPFLTRDALIAVALSFTAALLTVAFLMRWLRRASFTPLVAYRLALGLLLLAWIYT